MEFEKAYNSFLSQIRIKGQFNIEKDGLVAFDGYNVPVQKVLKDLGVKLSENGKYSNGAFNVTLLNEGNVCVYEYNKLMKLCRNKNTILAKDENNEAFLINYLTNPDKNLPEDTVDIESNIFFAIKSGAFKEAAPSTTNCINLKFSKNKLFLEDADYNIYHAGNKETTLESIKNDLKNCSPFINYYGDLKKYFDSKFVNKFMTLENADILTKDLVNKEGKIYDGAFIKTLIYQKAIKEAFDNCDIKKLENVIEKSKKLFEETMPIHAKYFEDFYQLYSFCDEEYEKALNTNKDFANNVRRIVSNFNNYFYNLPDTTQLFRAKDRYGINSYDRSEIQESVWRQINKDIKNILKNIDEDKVVSFDKAFMLLVNKSQKLSENEIHKLAAYLTMHKPKDFNKKDYNFKTYDGSYKSFLSKELLGPMSYQERMSFFETFPCEEFCEFITGDVLNTYLKKGNNEDKLDEVIKKVLMPTFYNYLGKESPTLHFYLNSANFYGSHLHMNEATKGLAKFTKIEQNEETYKRLETFESKILRTLYEDGFFNNYPQGILIVNHNTSEKTKISSHAFPGSHSYVPKYDEKEKIKFNQYVKIFDNGNKLYFTKAKDGRYHKNTEIFPCSKSNIAKELAAKFEYSKTKTPEFENLLSSFDGSEIAKDAFEIKNEEIIPENNEIKDIKPVTVENSSISSYMEKIDRIKDEVFDEEIKKDLDDIKGSLDSYKALNLEGKKIENFLEIYFEPVLNTISVQSNLYKNKNIDLNNEVLKTNRKLLKDTLKTVSTNLSQKVEDEIIYSTMISNSHLSAINEMLSSRNKIEDIR